VKQGMRCFVKQHLGSGPAAVAAVAACDDDMRTRVDRGVCAEAVAGTDDVDADRGREPRYPVQSCQPFDDWGRNGRSLTADERDPRAICGVVVAPPVLPVNRCGLEQG